MLLYAEIFIAWIRYFSNYLTLHRSDLAAWAAPLDPRLPKASTIMIKVRFSLACCNLPLKIGKSKTFLLIAAMFVYVLIYNFNFIKARHFSTDKWKGDRA